MKTEFYITFKTNLQPLNFVVFPTIWYWSECKNRPPYQTITFAWLWWQYSILLDHGGT